jgi:CheY-like chemotaxis protein
MNAPTLNRSESANGSKRVIYVVDDESMLLELVAVILEPLGCCIKTFGQPEAALQAFASAHPQPVLIITDFAMGTMNGLELIAECRRIQPHQKILLISGSVGPDVYQSAASQPDYYLGKPYQAKQLVELVKAILGD